MQNKFLVSTYKCHLSKNEGKNCVMLSAKVYVKIYFNILTFFSFRTHLHTLNTEALGMESLGTINKHLLPPLAACLCVPKFPNTKRLAYLSAL